MAKKHTQPENKPAAAFAPPRTITVGMAHHTDFNGILFTIQNIRINHRHLLPMMELVIIDNSPGTQDSTMLKDFVGKIGDFGLGVQYFEYTEAGGTSQTRDKIFRVAKGDAVICCDCHIMFYPGAIDAVLAYYKRPENQRDIVSGPLVYDDLKLHQNMGYATHFIDIWQQEMWGVWGAAWTCECDKGGAAHTVDDAPKTFGVHNNGGRLAYHNLDGLTRDYIEVANGESVPSLLPASGPDKCPGCGRAYPKIDWHKHEEGLALAGFRRAGAPGDRPFVIPGQGLGMFASLRQSWLGFNQYARGFGGEELYIHEKYRRAGGRAVCIPDAAWWHRFGRPGGVPYSLQRWSKIRNYVLEFIELDWDTKTDKSPIHRHWVKTGMLNQTAYDKLLENPIGYENEPGGGCQSCGGSAPSFSDLDEVYNKLRAIPRDLNEHMPTMRGLVEYVGEGCRVTEISNRRESVVGFLAGRPAVMRSYNTELRSDYARAAIGFVSGSGGQVIETEIDDSRMIPKIDECDILFIDSEHTYARAIEELHKYQSQVKRFIVLHDTQIFGDKGQDNGPGMLAAMRDFMRAVPQWSVYFDTAAQYGLTVLCRDPRDKPKPPGIVTKAKNFALALANHVATGAKDASPEVYEIRLDTCTVCPTRVEDACGRCGCPIADKAKWAEQECPLGKWLAAERERLGDKGKDVDAGDRPAPVDGGALPGG